MKITTEKKYWQNTRIRASLRVATGIFYVVTACAVILFSGDALAASKKSKSAKSQENPKYAALVMDAQTGEVLMARYADSQRHPASLTKIMTLYMLFEAIDSGKIRMNDRIPISTFAASKPPSKLGLSAGSTIRVEDAIKSLVTKSANDIATAIGEKLGGSERQFAAMMTSRAKQMGMTRTVFRNASGLPDPQQVTTARDMAKLSVAMLNDFPHYYHYFGVRNFEYRGANYHNHNRLLGSYKGLDGIKTGYINASGFNLIASAKQNNRRLVGVVFGGRTWKTRNDHMVKLLDEGFAEVAKRRTSPIQHASLSTAPVPLPPPMVDDIRGTAALALSDDNATDAAEDMPIVSASLTPVEATPLMDASYAPVPMMRPQALATPPEPRAPAARIIEQRASTPAPQITSAPLPARIPPQRMAANGQRTTTPASQPLASMNRTQQVVAPVNAPASSAPIAPRPPVTAQMAPVGRGASMAVQGGAPQTVMQLRIPRDQLPEGMRDMQPATQSNIRSWAIQVGAFHSRAMTDEALRTARSKLPTHLRHARPVIVPQNTGGTVLFRGRLQGFDELQANAACAHLGACLVVAPGS